MAGVATETGAAAVVMVAGGALEVVAGCGWWSRHAWTGKMREVMRMLGFVCNRNKWRGDVLEL